MLGLLVGGEKQSDSWEKKRKNLRGRSIIYLALHDSPLQRANISGEEGHVGY